MKKTWIIIISCIAALLVIGGGILAVVLLGGNDEPAKVDYDGKLYWNVERDMYKDGIFQHRQIEDNVYRLIFAVDGEQVQLDVKGWELVREIDSMSVMGLQFDENGLVVDAYHVDECTGGYLFNKGYVSEVNGNAVTINSNFAFRGLSKTLELDENTQIEVGGIEGHVAQSRRTRAHHAARHAKHPHGHPYRPRGDVEAVEQVVIALEEVEHEEQVYGDDRQEEQSLVRGHGHGGVLPHRDLVDNVVLVGGQPTDDAEGSAQKESPAIGLKGGEQGRECRQEDIEQGDEEDHDACAAILGEGEIEKVSLGGKQGDHGVEAPSGHQTADGAFKREG